MWYTLGSLFFYIYIIVYFRNKQKKYGSISINRKHHVTIAIIFILFGVFGVCFGDYFEYGALVKQAYQVYKSYGGSGWYAYLHMEPFWNYLAVFCHGNYTLWRLIWFIIEFSGVIYVFKRVNLNNYNALLVFSMFPLQSICGGRVSLGIAFFWLGLYSYLITKERKFLFFMLVSLFTHNSILLLFALTPLAIIKVNKLRLIAILFIIPIIASFLNDLLENTVNYIPLVSGSTYTEFIEARFNYGLSDEEASSYWGGSILEKIQATFLRLPLYYLCIKLFIDYFKGRLSLPGRTIYFFNLAFYLFVFTCVVLFGGVNSVSLYQRYFMMLFLPFFLIMYGLNSELYKKKKDFQICIFLIFLSFIVEYIKAIYYYSINGINIRLDV